MLITIPNVGNFQFYLGKAIKAAEKKAMTARGRLKGAKAERSSFVEREKVKALSASIAADLGAIEKSFPTIDDLPLFYQELIDVTIGKAQLKKAIAGVGWLRKKALQLGREYSARIHKSHDISSINKARREYVGRLASMSRKVGKDFAFLGEARAKMREFPSLRTKMKTVCIAGLPNVGKSTLLKSLTGASPEINVYPFTTKGLMLGYISNKVQVIDTPGAFRHELARMNSIEKQAFLALKHLCSTIIFVIDTTEMCGYSLEEQESMLQHIAEKFGKETIIYLSKTDLQGYEEKKGNFRKRHQNLEVFENSTALQKRLIRG